MPIVQHSLVKAHNDVPYHNHITHFLRGWSKSTNTLTVKPDCACHSTWVINWGRGRDKRSKIIPRVGRAREQCRISAHMHYMPSCQTRVNWPFFPTGYWSCFDVGNYFCSWQLPVANFTHIMIPPDHILPTILHVWLSRATPPSTW